jgi:hypothetical protein
MARRKAMTTAYRVDVIKLGQWDWAPGFEMFWMEPSAPDEPLALVSVIIRGNGNTIVVNTGPDPDFLPTMNERWANFDPRHQLRVTDDERLEPALAHVGVRLEDVDQVIVTPFQAYAIGNVLRFPRAEICLSRRGWIDFHAPRWRPHPHDNRALCIPKDVLIGLITDAWDRVRLLDDEEELAPGLSVFWTGVHHRNSVAVKALTAKGAVIASDAFFRYENVERMHPIGINESMEEALVAYSRIKRDANILIPLYDPRVFERHPGGHVA